MEIKDVGNGLNLIKDESGVTLIDSTLSLRVDFSSLKNRLKENNLNGEAVVRACAIKGNKNLTLIDATAGLGEDGFLLAYAGFSVTMIEYNPVIYALLSDGLKRAKEDKALKDVAEKIKLVFGNSIYELKKIKISPDVIYLDPMFPKRDKSGLIKKKFQLLQKLENPESSGLELIEASKEISPKKIVIKRPVNAENLGGIKPSYSITGSSLRFDCIVL